MVGLTSFVTGCFNIERFGAFPQGRSRRSFPLPEGALNDIPLITVHEY